MNINRTITDENIIKHPKTATKWTLLVKLFS